MTDRLAELEAMHAAMGRQIAALRAEQAGMPKPERKQLDVERMLAITERIAAIRRRRGRSHGT